MGDIDALKIWSLAQQYDHTSPEFVAALAAENATMRAERDEGLRLLENARQIERNVQSVREYEHKRAEAAIADIATLRASEATLAAQLAERDAELARVTAERDSAVITQAWTAGEPPKHIRNEWFIAKTIHGGRVVLRALPEDHSYDYTTKDETYMVAKNITHWMQFPDSNYVSFVPADYDALRASEAVAWAQMSDMREWAACILDQIVKDTLMTWPQKAAIHSAASRIRATPIALTTDKGAAT